MPHGEDDRVATAGVVIALLELFYSWILFLGMLVIPAAALVIPLAGVALFFSSTSR